MDNDTIKKEKDTLLSPSYELVDKELVRSFLALSVEQRISSNNNAIQTIMELRNGVLHAKCC